MKKTILVSVAVLFALALVAPVALAQATTAPVKKEAAPAKKEAEKKEVKKEDKMKSEKKSTKKAATTPAIKK